MNNNIIKKVIKKEFTVLKTKHLKSSIIYYCIFPLLLVTAMTCLMAFLMGTNTVTLDFDPDEELHTIITQNLKRVSVEYDSDEMIEEIEVSNLDYFVSKDNNQYIVYYNGITCNQELIDTITKILNDYCQKYSPDYEVKTIKITNVEGTVAAGLTKNQPLSIVPGMVLIATLALTIMSTVDMVAVEKEKGTLETMLTFPIKRKQIIFGKFCTSWIIAFGVSALVFLELFITIRGLTGFLDIYEKIGLPSILEGLMLIISFAFFAMLISTYVVYKSLKSRSAMDAQWKCILLNVVVLAVMFVSMSRPGIYLFTALIPIASQFYIINSVFTSEFSIMYCLLSIIMNLVIIWVLSEKINDITESDKILFE